jgi:hypothetical protein
MKSFNLRLLLFVCATLLLSIPLSAQLSFTNSSDLLTFTGVRSSHPMTIVDVNGDGLDDIVRLADGFEMYVAFQQLNGTFIEIHIGDFSEIIDSEDAWGMCAADINGNGICEIAFGGFYDSIKIITPGSTAEEFDMQLAPGEQIFVQAMAFADIDNDGYIDLIACHDDGPSKVLMNNGDGTFTESYEALETSIYPTDEDNSGNYGIVWSDVNNDGLLDCYISKCRQGVTDPTDVRRINQLLIQNSDGTYTEMAADYGLADGAQSWAADFGDFDNDGDQDVFIGNHDQPSRLMRNNGDGTFTNITTEAGLTGMFNFLIIQCTLRDFDNNGYLDILATGGTTFKLMLNNGDGTFSNSEINLGVNVNSYALGDLNNDGFIDLITTSGGYGGSWWGSSPDKLLLNDGNDNNYITFNLEGNQSNPNGIGAKIVLTGPFGMMVREVKAGESYGIMNSMQVHFGLGQNEEIDLATIYWPSGVVDVFPLPDINSNHFIVEGSFPSGIAESILTKTKTSIFPNPMINQSVIEISNYDFSKGSLNLDIFDLSGKLVRSETIIQNRQNINRGTLSEGLYQVRVNYKNETISTTSLFVK